MGRNKVVFGSKDSALQVKKKLEEAYQNGGGFEILCSGYSSGKSLVVLRPPVSVGHLIKFLRDGSGLGASIGLHSPTTKSLDVHAEEVSLSEVIAN